MDAAKRRKRILLQGDVPSPVNPPAGCRFHPRCPLARDICCTATPREMNLAGHLVRCHAVEEAMSQGAHDAVEISHWIGKQIAAHATESQPVA
jgi:ABC-type oligopeptide transport system ATPase subunit